MRSAPRRETSPDLILISTGSMSLDDVLSERAASVNWKPSFRASERADF